MTTATHTNSVRTLTNAVLAKMNAGAAVKKNRASALAAMSARTEATALAVSTAHRFRALSSAAERTARVEARLKAALAANVALKCQREQAAMAAKEEASWRVQLADSAMRLGQTGQARGMALSAEALVALHIAHLNGNSHSAAIDALNGTQVALAQASVELAMLSEARTTAQSLAAVCAADCKVRTDAAGKAALNAVLALTHVTKMEAATDARLVATVATLESQCEGELARVARRVAVACVGAAQDQARSAAAAASEKAQACVALNHTQALAQTDAAEVRVTKLVVESLLGWAGDGSTMGVGHEGPGRQLLVAARTALAAEVRFLISIH